LWKALVRVIIACVQRLKTVGRLVLLPEVIFFFIFLLCASTVAVLMPAGTGLDEGSHIARTVQLSHGQLFSSEVHMPGDPNPRDKQEDKLYGGVMDDAIMKVWTANSSNFPKIEKFDFPTWKDQRLNVDLETGKSSSQYYFSNASVNSPICYIPQILGYWVAQLFTNSAYWQILGMRLGGCCFSPLLWLL
jgi:uncharacterized membrane protein